MTLWSPSQLPSIDLWLDAADSDTITIATGVSQWSDKSGNGRHATQVTAGSQPAVTSAGLNGLNVVTWDGSGKKLAGTLSKTYTARTVFIVFSYSGSQLNQRPFTQYLNGYDDWTTPGWCLPVARNQGNDQFGTEVNTGRIAQVTTTQLTPLLYVHTHTGSLISTYLNGNTPATASNALNLTVDKYMLGTNPVSNDAKLTGYIAEVIVLDYVPDTTTRQIIEGYLAWKWGIQANLPTDHLYFSSAPTSFNGDISFNGPQVIINVSGAGNVLLIAPHITTSISGGGNTVFAGSHPIVNLMGGGRTSFNGPNISSNASGGGQSSFNAHLLAPINLLGGGFASFDAPDIPLDIWYDSGRMSFEAPEIPPIVIGGGYSHFKAPKEQVNIDGTVNNNGMMSFVGPKMKVNISGTVDTIGWMSFPGPKIKVNIDGKVGSVGSISFKAPKIAVSMSGTVDTIGWISFQGPRLGVNITGKTGSVGSMSFKAPGIKVNMSGFDNTISFPGPKIKVNITGKVGIVGSLSFKAPKMKVNISGYTTSGDMSFPGPGMKVNMSGGLVHNYGVLKYIKGQIR